MGDEKKFGWKFGGLEVFALVFGTVFLVNTFSYLYVRPMSPPKPKSDYWK